MKRLRDLLTEGETFAGGDKVKVKGGKRGRVLHATRTAGGIKYLVILSDGSENTYGASALTRVEDTFDDSDHQEREVFKGTPIMNFHGSHAQEKKPLNESNLFILREEEAKLEHEAEPTPMMDEPHLNDHIVKHDPIVHGKHNDSEIGKAVLRHLVDAHPNMHKHPGYSAMRDYTSHSRDMNQHLHKQYMKNFRKKDEFEDKHDYKRRMKDLQYDHRRHEKKAMHLDKLAKDHPLADHVHVFHGAGFDVHEAASADPERKLYAPSFLSTSTSKETAASFARGQGDHNIRHVIHMHLPKGHPAIVTGKHSHHENENEIILGRHTTIKIPEKPRVMTHDGGTYHVWDGEIVPNEIADRTPSKRKKFEKSVERHARIGAGHATDEDIESAIKDPNASEEHSAIFHDPDMLKKHRDVIYNNMKHMDDFQLDTLAQHEMSNKDLSKKHLTQLLDHNSYARRRVNDHDALGPEHLKHFVGENSVSNENAVRHLLAGGQLSKEQKSQISDDSRYNHLMMADKSFTKSKVNKAVGQIIEDGKMRGGYNNKQLKALIENPHFSQEHFDKLVENDPDGGFAKQHLSHKFAGDALHESLVNSREWTARSAAAKSPNLPKHLYSKLMGDEDYDVVNALMDGPNGKKISSAQVKKALNDKINAGQPFNTSSLVNKLNEKHLGEMMDHPGLEGHHMDHLLYHPDSKNFTDKLLNDPHLSNDHKQYIINHHPLDSHHIDKVLADHSGHIDHGIEYASWMNPDRANVLANKALENGDHHGALWWHGRGDLMNGMNSDFINKVANHLVDHGDPSKADSAIPTLAARRKYMSPETINKVLNSVHGSKFAIRGEWNNVDHLKDGDLDTMFKNVKEGIRHHIMDSWTTHPTIQQHLMKTATPEQLAGLFGSQSHNMTPEQQQQAVDHIMNKYPTEHQDDDWSQLSNLLEQSEHRGKVTKEQAHGLMHHLAMEHDPSYNQENSFRHLSDLHGVPDEMMAQAHTMGPEMAQHVIRHIDGAKHSNVINQIVQKASNGQSYTASSNANWLTEKHKSHITPATWQNVLDNNYNHQYETVARAKLALKQHNDKNAENIRWRKPADTD